MRSAEDVHNYLHMYFLNIASINLDYPTMLGGELTQKEINFMVNLRSELCVRGMWSTGAVAGVEAL
jgi:hypothetical protein